MILSLSVTCITILLFLVTALFFPSIKLGKLHLSTFWMVTLLGALLLLACQCVDRKEVISSFASDSGINPLKILVLFLSRTILSIFLDEQGFFSFLAESFAKKFRKNQYSLFLCLYLLISVLTVFTSNDIIILTFTPFLCYFCKRCKVSPLPYLIREFVAANTWSSLLIIGNPTNIYLASYENISFFTYFEKRSVPTIVGGLVSLLRLLIILHKNLKDPLLYQDDSQSIQLKKFPTIVGLIHLCGATILLSISSFCNWPRWLIALCFALSLLIYSLVYSLVTKENHIVPTLKRIPYNLVPFVLSRFVLVLAINETGVSLHISQALQSTNQVFSYGLSGLLTANLINNIPRAVFYSTLLTGAQTNAIYASIIASNVAAFFTPIGALAGLRWRNLLKKQEIKRNYLTFIKYCAPICIPTLLSMLIVLNFLPY